MGLFDGDVLDNKYDVLLPEGSIIEIKRSKTMRIFLLKCYLVDDQKSKAYYL